MEACPTEAITESKLFEFSFTNRRDAVYTKDELMVDDDGRPKDLPWEDWRTGDDADDLGLDAGHRSPPVAPRSRGSRRGPASSATACAPPEPPQAEVDAADARERPREPGRRARPEDHH